MCHVLKTSIHHQAGNLFVSHHSYLWNNIPINDWKCFSDRVPKYIINLDLPPEERWTQLMMDKKESVRDFSLCTISCPWLIRNSKHIIFIQALNLLQDIKNYTESFFKGRLFKFVDKYLPMMAKTLPEPYLSELKGIAKIADIPLGEITLYNIFYEVFTVCTSLISQGADGKVYHARNLDFGLLLG